MHPPYLNGIIFLAALGGFAIAAYIRYKKSHAEALVCPFNLDCNAVTHSPYASILGIPVEGIGMLYYGGFLLVYGAALIRPEITASAPVAAGLTVLASFAAAFSVYLFFVQAILKEWCAWCLLSLLASLIIFYCVVFG